MSNEKLKDILCSCGAVLTDEERKYYGTSCEKCEQKHLEWISNETKQAIEGKSECPSGAACSTAEPAIDWMIWYEDQDKRPEVFSEEDIAKKRFSIAGDSWTCHLFKRIASR